MVGWKCFFFFFFFLKNCCSPCMGPRHIVFPLSTQIVSLWKNYSFKYFIAFLFLILLCLRLIINWFFQIKGYLGFLVLDKAQRESGTGFMHWGPSPTWSIEAPHPLDVLTGSLFSPRIPRCFTCLRSSLFTLNTLTAGALVTTNLRENLNWNFQATTFRWYHFYSVSSSFGSQEFCYFTL